VNDHATATTNGSSKRIPSARGRAAMDPHQRTGPIPGRRPAAATVRFHDSEPRLAGRTR
jgi:hypothetical protein